MSDSTRNEQENSNVFINRIVTEKSGILYALGKTADQPSENDSEEVRRGKMVAIQRQRAERERFLKRYQTAIMAYVGVYLKDRDATSTVWERFVDKWLDGKLCGYDPARSFRFYLKEVLRNEVYAYWSKCGKELSTAPRRLDSGYDHVDNLEHTADELFDQKLSDSILASAEEAVRLEDEQYYLVLAAMKNAALSDMKMPSSRELAAILSQSLGTRISEDNARQIKNRAKRMYSRKIIQQTCQLIDEDDLNVVRQTLDELGLLVYCAKAMDEMQGRASA